MKPRQVSGMKLRLIRKKRGLTQADLAAIIGCSPGRISHFETNRGGKIESVIQKVAASLGVEVSEITEPVIDWDLD